MAKILVQYLWSLKLDWDESVPQHVQPEWENFRAGLPQLTALYVPRHVILKSSAEVELHGFVDASEKAYAAAIYI